MPPPPDPHEPREEGLVAELLVGLVAGLKQEHGAVDVLLDLRAAHDSADPPTSDRLDGGLELIGDRLLYAATLDRLQRSVELSTERATRQPGLRTGWSG